MFDISFSEILLIGVVALVVLGPERLPTVARTLAALVGKAQRFVASVKADIQHQANLTGIDSLRHDLQDAADTFRQRIESEVQEVRQVMDQQAEAVRQLGQEAAAPLHEAERTIHDSVAEAQAAAGPDLFSDAPAAAHGLPEETPQAPRDENQLDLFDETPPVASSPSPESEARPRA